MDKGANGGPFKTPADARGLRGAQFPLSPYS